MVENESYDSVNVATMIMNLEEAMEQLRETIKALQNDPSYGYGSFRADMAHAYHHLNYAWNVRHATAIEIDTEESFARLSKFPVDEFDQYRG